MEREKLESMIVEYIDGTLNPEERERLEYLIQTNLEASHLFHQTKKVMEVMERSSQMEPSTTMKKRFEDELQKMMSGHKEAKVVSMNQKWVYRMAAGIALVLVSGALVFWINRSYQQGQELARLKKEMEEHKTMMLTMMGNQASAGQRIQGVSVAYTMEKADDEIVNALVKTLNADQNTNVRLAALDALSKFNTQPHVRSALIQSLSTQTDAVVQIALIRLLVDMKAKQSIEELRRITNDSEVLPAVKDEAYAGIMKLS